MNKLLLGALSAILILITFRVSAAPAQAPAGWNMGFSAGATFPIAAHNNVVNTGPEWPADLYHYQQVNSAAMLGLTLAHTWRNEQDWLPAYSLGLNYTYAFAATLNGKIDQYSLPHFENYSYQYKIERQTWLAIVKTDFYRWSWIMPFLSVGAGVSLNRARDYSEYALANITARNTPGFASRTTTDFSYLLGAGIDIVALPNLLFSLEYNYGYFGNANTANGDLGYGSSQLSTKFSANILLLSANYYFENR